MKKKILISAAVSGLTLAPALSLVTSCTRVAKIKEVHIININDFHGAAPGYGDKDFSLTNMNNPGAIRLASEFEEIKAKYPGTIVLAGGDLNAGEGFSTCEHAETFYPVLRAMDIRYSTVGNHAWEWGSEPLIKHRYDNLARTDNTEGNYFFTSNVLDDPKLDYREKTWESDPKKSGFESDYNLWKKQRVEWADAYKLVDLNGHKVCLIGLTTKDTLTDGNMESMKTLSFIDYNASVNYSKALCYEIIGKEEFDKIEAFILDTHLECQAIDDKKPFEGVVGEAATLAKDLTTRVDAIFAAHSHMICKGIIHNDNFNKDIPIAQGGQGGRRYIDAALKFKDVNPVGKRLDSITLDVVTPKIDGIEDTEHPDKDKAEAQIKKIVETTNSQLVKNVANVYAWQKKIALKNLETVIGSLHKVPFDTKKESHTGLPYWYTEGNKEFGTKFFQSPLLLEPAGVWANIAMIDSFNKHYKTYIETEKKCLPAAVAFTNLDSLKSGFNMTTSKEDEDLPRKQVYQMHAFENNVHYGCLTIDQLKQYINYFLDGAGKFNYGNKTGYTGTLTLDGKEGGPAIPWGDKEIVNVNTTKDKGTSYVSGLNQFHGLRFKIKVKEQTKPTPEGYNVYELDTSEKIKIYNPLATNPKQSLYEPEGWTSEDDWAKPVAQGGFGSKYIPMIMASFTWQGGNAQNRMLHHWFDENVKKEDSETLKKQISHQIFDMYTRATALEYIDNLKTEHSTWAVNQISDSAYIDEAFIKKILIR